MKKIILPLILIAIFSLVLLPSLVLAQDTPLERLQRVQDTADFADAPLEETIGLLMNTAFSLVGVILIVLMLYAGYLWMTAGGSDDQVGKAKTIIKNSIIGLIITVLAYGIANFVVTAVIDAAAAG